MQLSLNYDRKFGDHSINVLALFEEQYNQWENFYAQRSMLLDGEYLLYGENEGQIGKMDGAGDKTRRAFIGRMNYDYKGRYMVDFRCVMTDLPVSRKILVGGFSPLFL